MSIALGQPINIIFDDAVWLTAAEGFNHSYSSLLLTSHVTAILCEEEPQVEEDLSHLGAAAPSHCCPDSKRRGYPLASILEYPNHLDSDRTDTDPEELMSAETHARQLIPHAGQVIPRKCLVCDVSLVSGMALFRHLQQVHPHDRPYNCKDCASSYNNLKELSLHRSNFYHASTVLGSHCEYSCISKAKM